MTTKYPPYVRFRRTYGGYHYVTACTAIGESFILGMGRTWEEAIDEARQVLRNMEQQLTEELADREGRLRRMKI